MPCAAKGGKGFAERVSASSAISWT
ncbi:hypothetical protein AHiyo1_34110, partial [Arthrobacter sp. Hiyo1]